MAVGLLCFLHHLLCVRGHTFSPVHAEVRGQLGWSGSPPFTRGASGWAMLLALGPLSLPASRPLSPHSGHPGVRKYPLFLSPRPHTARESVSPPGAGNRYLSLTSAPGTQQALNACNPEWSRQARAAEWVLPPCSREETEAQRHGGRAGTLALRHMLELLCWVPRDCCSPSRVGLPQQPTPLGPALLRTLRPSHPLCPSLGSLTPGSWDLAPRMNGGFQTSSPGVQVIMAGSSGPGETLQLSRWPAVPGGSFGVPVAQQVSQTQSRELQA